MRVALVNPDWSFEGSIYFGCREPHLPLEYGYAAALLERDGHQVLLLDGLLEGLTLEAMAARLADFAPDMTVVTTAPSYLFWRCAPPELRVPMRTLDALRRHAGLTVAVGPHGSTTPRATLAKLGVDVVVMGECEEVLARLANAESGWGEIPGLCYQSWGEVRLQGGPQAADLGSLPALRWPARLLARHGHHHHRFDAAADGPGAEMETSRGCPYHCSFCAKENFRDRYRRRPLPVLLDELDGLIAAGATYVYFVDEIFLPNRPLLEALVERDIRFGVQTRIDLWKPEMIALLGRAGCVSIEAGVESLTPEGRDRLDKDCRMSTADLTERLILAKRAVPFVQANLIAAGDDDEESIEAWRAELQRHGVWANKPVPLFPYPGSPDYRKLWGLPDDHAWERALDHYLDRHAAFSDIQEERPRRLAELEAAAR
jgi:B12-binding domain/radical SAM domain protein of rhizo-twelve system